MKYALVAHLNSEIGRVNIGDYIQVLAAEQYLPKVDFYVERDKLNASEYDEAKVIMNGWFTHKPENWPPNKNLKPLFISFHLNPAHAPKLLSKSENVEYLKEHSPIGCRDHTTLKILQEFKIPSYYSFCLTSTLDIKYKNEVKTNDIIFSDVIYKLQPKSEMGVKVQDKNILKKVRRLISERIKGSKRKELISKIIPEHVFKNGVHVVQEFQGGKAPEEYMEISKNLLKQYAAAKLVVTSRIHCAIPCLALGTPVLFIPDGIHTGETEISRLNGVVQYMNILTLQSPESIKKVFGDISNVYGPDDIDWDNPPINPGTHLKLSEELRKKCYDFVS